MKGVSQTLWIVIAVVVLLVAALVVLTIFGGGLTPVVEATQQTNICMQQLSLTCSTTGTVPPGWSSVKYTVKNGDEMSSKSCSELTGENSCPAS